MGPLLAAALIAAAGMPEYPVADVLGAAKSVCGTALASDEPSQQLIQAGWAPATVEPGSWIEQSLREEREMFGPGFPPSKVYVKSVSGRSLFAFIAGLRMKDSLLRLCSVQDPEADIQSAQDRIFAWAGRSPTSLSLLSPEMERGLNDLAFNKNWKPGLDEGADDTTIRYVPRQYSRGESAGLTYASEREVGIESK